MSSVNGVGSTPTFEKYQGSEKLPEKRVGAGSKNQGSQGVGGAGSQISRRGLDGDGKKSAAGGKAQKADPFKQILKMLKGLLEALNVMIAKLSGSASSEAPSKAKTEATTNATNASSSGGVEAGGVSSSGATTSTGASTSTATNAPPTNSDGVVLNSIGDTSLTNTSEATTPVTTASSTDGLSDDLSVREESEATRAAIPATSNGEVQKGEGLQALKDETGAVSVLTDDGFTIRADVKDQAWTILGPDGFATRIWGDPHVTESDGDTWDFLKQSTFLFGKNKVTVEVVPAGNGMTYSSRISVYSGDDRVTISGIESNKPTIDAVARDGEQHDAQLSDGIVFTRRENTRGESWSQMVDGKKDVMGH